jgi:hypothetical protein
VKRAIMSLKNGRMCGPEVICAEFLKGGKTIQNVEQHHQYLNGQSVADQWKMAHISSIYKKISRRIQTIKEFRY